MREHDALRQTRRARGPEDDDQTIFQCLRVCDALPRQFLRSDTIDTPIERLKRPVPSIRLQQEDIAQRDPSLLRSLGRYILMLRSTDQKSRCPDIDLPVQFCNGRARTRGGVHASRGDDAVEQR